jgi:hypothetical protein
LICYFEFLQTEKCRAIAFFSCAFFPLSGAVSVPVKLSKGDDTKIDAFGVELSSHVKWLIPVSLLVVGILGIIYVATKIFMRYE